MRLLMRSGMGLQMRILISVHNLDDSSRTVSIIQSTVSLNQVPKIAKHPIHLRQQQACFEERSRDEYCSLRVWFWVKRAEMCVLNLLLSVRAIGIKFELGIFRSHSL